ncbi:MAG: inositol 2-dehydrogenase [Anaerolineae bacterium]|nr:inositol 2-dehydrogenase [Anaerolineae bacterium]
MLQVGLIGAGRIGKIHGETLARRLDTARLAAVADINLTAAEELAGRMGVERAVADYRHLLDDPAIDAIVIASASNTHAQIVEEAASAGKDIFCEKPIDFDLARIDHALAAVRAAGVKLQVGFNRRFDPNFSKVREMVLAGRIGEPHILRITSRDPAPPPIEYVKVSGGLFLDMTIHDFDMARYLIGSEVTEVYATGAVLVDPAIGEAGDVDTAVTTLTFANGVIGTIDNSRRAVYGYDQRVEVFGSEGMVAAGNDVPDTHVYANAEGVHSALPVYFFLERYLGSYIAEMQAFVEAVVQDTPPPVTGEDGRIPVVIGLAAQKSLRERRPVAID